MKSPVWPPVLFMLSVVAMFCFFTATQPWEMFLVLIPIACLTLFYFWLDNRDQP